MILVLKENIIQAAHEDRQYDDIINKYDNCIFIKVPNSSDIEIGSTYEMKVEDIRTLKLKQLSDDFNNLVSQGYYSADFNITLALRLEDINIFSALINMLNLATRRGFSIPSVEVADINGTSFNFDTDNAELLLLAYGVYYRSLWAENIRKTNIINSETDPVKLMDLDINTI
jgi:hypothetical protein